MNPASINSLLKSFENYYYNEEYDKAKKVSKQITEYYKNNMPEKAQNYYTHLYNLSLVFYFSGDTASAIKICRKLYTMLSSEKNSSLLASVANNLGVFCSSAGKKSSALAYFKKARYIRSINADYNDPALADTISNLGNVYYDLKHYEQALVYHKDALDRYPKNSESYILTLSLIGWDYEKLKDYKNAVSYLKQSVELMPQENNEEYIASLYYLAEVYAKNGECENALTAYERVLFLSKKEGLNNEPFYGEAINKTADIYYSLSNYKKALELRLKALDIFERQLGAKNMFYANCLKEIAKIYNKNYIYGKAIAYMKQVLEIKSALMTPEDTDYLEDALFLSKLYTANGQHTNSSDVLEYLAANIPPSSQNYTKILLMLVNRYRSSNDLQKLYSAYDRYKEKDPTITFDELLLLAEAAEQS